MSTHKEAPPSESPTLAPDAASIAAVQKMLRGSRAGGSRKGRKEVRRENLMRRVMSHPVRAVPLAFLLVIIIGAALLMLPAARTDGGTEGFMPALFTSVSAVCVTGLIIVDTATFWTPFGQGIILGLIQVAGSAS
jgi:trk system potassium uptake protein TrkH